MSIYNSLFYKSLEFDPPSAQGIPYFESGVTGKVQVGPRINREMRSKTEMELVIYLVYRWGTITVLSFPALIAIRHELSTINNGDNIIFEVLSFITQATRDCVIRAKQVMMNGSAEQRPALKSILVQLDRKMIAPVTGIISSSSMDSCTFCMEL